jgi:uncharacterized BrkB/YihY/UPF0761 family membrane protein
MKALAWLFILVTPVIAQIVAFMALHSRIRARVAAHIWSIAEACSVFCGVILIAPFVISAVWTFFWWCLFSNVPALAPRGWDNDVLLGAYVVFCMCCFASAMSAFAGIPSFIDARRESNDMSNFSSSGRESA